MLFLTGGQWRTQCALYSVLVGGAATTKGVNEMMGLRHIGRRTGVPVLVPKDLCRSRKI